MNEHGNVITSEEAFLFLHDVLDIACPKMKMEDDPRSLLDEIISSWRHRIPFQTIKMIATPSDRRHLPTLQEIKGDIFAKLGGSCYDNNVGCYLVLRALGFDASLLAGDVGLRNNHSTVVVHDLERDGSRHLVDVGSGGYPTFLAIPLEFQVESPEYHQSYLKYKYVVEGDIMTRVHNADSNSAGASWFSDVTVDGWYPYCAIHHKTPVEISHFRDVTEKLYTKVLPCPPLLSRPIATAFPQGRFVCIRNTTLLLEDFDGKVKKTYMKSPDELLQAYAKYFPQLPQEMVQAALDDVNVKLDFDRV